MSVFRRYKTCWRGLQILLTSGKNPCDPRADSPFGNLDHGILHNMSFTQLGHICHNNTYQYYTIIIKAVNTRADICHNFNPFAERSASISTLVALITTIMARSRTLHLLNVPASMTFLRNAKEEEEEEEEESDIWSRFGRRVICAHK